MVKCLTKMTTAPVPELQKFSSSLTFLLKPSSVLSASMESWRRPFPLGETQQSPVSVPLLHIVLSTGLTLHLHPFKGGTSARGAGSTQVGSTRASP